MGNTRNHNLIIDGIALSVLLLSTAALRLHSLGVKYFNIDEAFQFFVVGQPTWPRALKAIQSMGPIQPLGDFAIDFIFSKFAPGLFNLRLLMVFWGLCAVTVLYLTGVLLNHRALGWTAAFLLSFSLLHIEFSQTLRHYSLITFLSTLTFYSFLRLLQSRRWVFFYGISMALFQLAYPYAAVVAAIHIIYCLWREKSSLKVTALGLIPLILSAGVWFCVVGRNFSSHSSFFCSRELILSGPVLTDLLLQFGQNSGFMASLYLILVLIGVWTLLQNKMDQRAGWITAMMLVILLASVFSSLLLIRQAFYPRYVIALLPFYLLLGAQGLLTTADTLSTLTLFSNRHRNTARVCLMIVFSVGLAGGANRPYQKYVKSQEAIHNGFILSSSTLRARTDINDAVIFSNPNMGATYLYYLNPNLFFRLENPVLDQGIGVFQFPKNSLNASETSGPRFYTIHLRNPRLGTMTGIEWTRLMNQIVSKNSSVWLVALPFNYFSEPHPLEFLKLPETVSAERAGPGLTLLKSRTQSASQ